MKFEVSKSYDPLKMDCLGVGFITKIEGNRIEIKISDLVVCVQNHLAHFTIVQ